MVIIDTYLSEGVTRGPHCRFSLHKVLQIGALSHTGGDPFGGVVEGGGWAVGYAVPYNTVYS